MREETSDSALPPVVVIALDELPGLQTARIFHRKGVEVIGVVANRTHFSCRTNTVSKIIQTNTWSKPLVDALEKLGESYPVRPVLIPCIDEAVLQISRNRARLEPYFRFAMPNAQIVEDLTHKKPFFLFAQERQLPIPKTFLVTNREEAERAAAELEYPCVLKPTIKSPKWWRAFGAKALLPESRDELMRAFERAREHSKTLIFQEWVRGGEDELFSVNCYYDQSGVAQVNFVARKLRQWPPFTGFTSLGEEVRNDEVLKLCHQVFGSVRYRGLGYLEVKRDSKTGQHKVIEANVCRPTGRSALAEGCGVELLYTMYCDLVGLALPEQREQTYRGGRWVQVLNDLRSAHFFWKRGELSLMAYLRSMRNIKAYAVWSLSDPKPFLRQLKLVARSSLKRKLRRLLRR